MHASDPKVGGRRSGSLAIRRLLRFRAAWATPKGRPGSVAWRQPTYGTNSEGRASARRAGPEGTDKRRWNIPRDPPPRRSAHPKVSGLRLRRDRLRRAGRSPAHSPGGLGTGGSSATPCGTRGPRIGWAARHRRAHPKVVVDAPRVAHPEGWLRPTPPAIPEGWRRCIPTPEGVGLVAPADPPASWRGRSRARQTTSPPGTARARSEDRVLPTTRRSWGRRSRVGGAVVAAQPPRRVRIRRGYRSARADPDRSPERAPEPKLECFRSASTEGGRGPPTGRTGQAMESNVSMVTSKNISEDWFSR